MTAQLDRGGADAGLVLWDRFDQMLDDWAKLVPFRSAFPRDGWEAAQVIRVDEVREGDTLVIRAEMPGVDPDKDVEVTVADGTLHIKADHKEETTTEEKGFVRRELRRGRFSRTLPVPPGITEADVGATYKDGILELRVPMPAAAVEPPKRVTITKAT